ncbi:MAG: hypothetical protein JRI68_23035 [Deltaproteobacteria bacterium]|nr:hypothetical protein [Deltaproteobacteria bacterium]
MNRTAMLTLLVVSSGCGGDETEPAPPEPLPDCAEHELPLPDGSCVRPGAALDGCGEGFVHDGIYGCEPILPAEPCPPGLMAVPGEDTCRSVMDCGSGKWGDLPVDDLTQYVDGTYGGGDSDGTAAKPWSTIGEGVSAAAPGALIAVAAGSYGENLLISGKPVRLWGVCPEQVVVEATGQPAGPCPPAAVCITDGASGTEVGGLAVRGAGMGVALSGSEGVLIDRARVYDNATLGINADSALGPTSLHIRGSLIEQNYGEGMFFQGALVTVDATVVRTTVPPASDLSRGLGITMQLPCVAASGGLQCDLAARGTINVTRSVIEQNHGLGLLVIGSDATVDTSVVRTTLPHPSGQPGGGGIAAQPACFATSAGLQCDPATRSSASVTRSVIENNHGVGLLVDASDATVDTSVVRGAADPSGWRGIAVQLACSDTPEGQQCDLAARGTASVSRSLVEDNHQAGLLVIGSDVTVDASVVRATVSGPSDQLGGGGVLTQLWCPDTPTGQPCDPAAGSTAGVTRSLIEDNHGVGMLVIGSDATVDGSVVRRTLPSGADQSNGLGISIQLNCDPTPMGWQCDPTTRSSANVTRSVIEQNYTHGLLVVGSDAVLDGLLVRTTWPRASDQLFGDGVTITTMGAPSSATITNLHIADSARAGLVSFGASVSLADTQIRCAAFDLTGEPSDGADFEIVDHGGNSCGCPTADGTCKAVSAGLQPPDPLPASE